MSFSLSDIKVMVKKIFLICTIFFLALRSFSDGHKTIILGINDGSLEFYVQCYVFNELSEGKEITENVFGFKDFEKMVRPENFKLLQRMSPDCRLHGYGYGIFRAGNEFWILKNYEDAYIYGSGFYLN